MTVNFNSLTVVLEKDIREDDGEHLIKAIKMFKGVLSVKGNESDITDLIARERVNAEWRNKLLDLIRI